jgi:hypothetical protein
MSGEDPQQFGASVNSPGALLMRQQPLTAILQHVAAYAAAAIPGADGAGLTLLDDGRADTIVASEPFVVAVDELQYRLGQGPVCPRSPGRGLGPAVAGEGAGVVDRGRVAFVVTDYFSCAASWPASFLASP